MSASRKIVNLVDPANPPSKKAPLVWAIGAAIPWLILAAGQVVWFALDRRLGWLHAVAAAVTVLGFVVFVAVVPLWRYRVHRWDIGPKAVYTRAGWLVQEPYRFATGRDDSNVEESRRIAAVLQDKGVPASLHLWDGWAHDWPFWKEMVDVFL